MSQPAYDKYNLKTEPDILIDDQEEPLLLNPSKYSTPSQNHYDADFDEESK